MKTVLVTGPIGGGKSSVCRHLAEAGYPVYDCDSRCKALYGTVPGLKERIESELGIPFSGLAAIFSDNALRERLEGIVYPLLVEDIEEWKSSLDSPLAFIESAIAMEKPAFSHLYDSVLMVTAPLKTRASRNPKVAERDALQSFDKDKIDYTICNDSTLEALYLQTDKYLATL